ncbi:MULTISPECIES: damage-control phosphatase ARMT1 family protein [Streptomyces]|uniref:damage-control phosphatase ARMT1 family protein n=1 Tax=Streptomyces TaxID=1883 RepID=UPI0004CB6E44|nr:MULTISPECIES: damage-control phosphatase ARMT1 family protein [Streptomyces]QHF95814.1 protein-glutamate O-methyltransferase family protein [Streptomyces sp. NHF165]
MEASPSGAQQAPEIVSSVPGTFAHGVWTERHPALLRRLTEATPYGPRQRDALDALLTETLHGTVAALPEHAQDAALWNGPWDRGHYGRRWLQAPFLWAESYFYRRLRTATGYADPQEDGGARRGVDPFAPFKEAELAGEGVDEQLAALDGLDGADEAERTDALLLGALWGNRADLGFLLTSDEASGDRPLVADERPALHRLLAGAAERGAVPGRIVLVADNAGRELIADLLLLAHLLETGTATEVLLHVKPHPYYVSDAVPADVLAAVRRIAAAPAAAGRAGRLLTGALREGRLLVRSHPFSCAPLGYAAMPGDLRADFASAALTLLKGDLNYRRLVGDRHWPATTPFAEVTAGFPGPLGALRTLKSEVVTGLAASTAAALDDSGEEWRTNGQHALIQVREAEAE